MSYKILYAIARFTANIIIKIRSESAIAICKFTFSATRSPRMSIRWLSDGKIGQLSEVIASSPVSYLHCSRLSTSHCSHIGAAEGSSFTSDSCPIFPPFHGRICRGPTGVVSPVKPSLCCPRCAPRGTPEKK